MENDIILKFFQIEHRIAATTSYVSDIIRTKGYIGNNAKNHYTLPFQANPRGLLAVFISCVRICHTK